MRVATEGDNGKMPTMFPSAVKTTLPVGVPDALDTLAFKVTGLWTRAGLGKAVKVMLGADAAGWEEFTETEAGDPVLLLRKRVLVAGSRAPVKLALMLLCRPATENEVVMAATP